MAKRIILKKAEGVMHSLFIRVLVFAVVLLISTASYAQNPRATITFDNRSGDPALVKVIGPSRHLVEVPNRRKRTVKVVGGQYHIVTRYGANPDRYRYSRGDGFKVTQTATRYSRITITLHKVVGGNYPTHPISAKEFEQAKH
jgi:hypothetical protein